VQRHVAEDKPTWTPTQTSACPKQFSDWSDPAMDQGGTEPRTGTVWTLVYMYRRNHAILTGNAITVNTDVLKSLEQWAERTYTGPVFCCSALMRSSVDAASSIAELTLSVSRRSTSGSDSAWWSDVDNLPRPATYQLLRHSPYTRHICHFSLSILHDDILQCSHAADWVTLPSAYNNSPHAKLPSSHTHYV